MRDEQRARPTVDAAWNALTPPPIRGVTVTDVKNVVIKNGVLTEIYRSDWFGESFQARHIVHVSLLPGHVSQWHMHRAQHDLVFPVRGHIKVGLFDDREASPTYRAGMTMFFNLHRPRFIEIPSGVWHGLKNVGSDEAAYIVVNDVLFDYADPDDWILPAGAPQIPVDL